MVRSPPSSLISGLGIRWDHPNMRRVFAGGLSHNTAELWFKAHRDLVKHYLSSTLNARAGKEHSTYLPLLPAPRPRSTVGPAEHRPVRCAIV